MGVISIVNEDYKPTNITGGHHVATVNPSFVAGCCRDQPSGGRHRLHHLSDRLRSGERLASCIAPARGDAWAEGLSEMFQVYPLGAGIFVYYIYIYNV